MGLPVFFIMCVCTAAEKLEQAESQLAHSNRLGGGFLMMSAKKKDVSTHSLDTYAVKAFMVLGFICEHSATTIEDARCQLFFPASRVCSGRLPISFAVSAEILHQILQKSGDAHLDPGVCCGERQSSNIQLVY